MKPLLVIPATVLALLSAFAGFDNSSAAQVRRVRVQMLRAEPLTDLHLTVLERAYVDTAAILDKNNACSHFFGGPESRKVLDELVVGLREHCFNDPRIAVRMSGPFELHVSPENGVSYRLFAEAELNTAGPFFRSKTFRAEPFVPNVGSFRPNTKEARVLILLHELAHLIKGSKGTWLWLIPDAGGDPQLSRLNTLSVESQCGQQIRALQ